MEVQLPGANTRLVDILVEDPSDAAPVAVDVSVVHPLHPSAVLAEDTPGSAAAAREAEKRATNAAKAFSDHCMAGPTWLKGMTLKVSPRSLYNYLSTVQSEPATGRTVHNETCSREG